MIQGKRSDSWPRRRPFAEGQVTSASCDPAAEPDDRRACIEAIETALSGARDIGASRE